MALGSSTRMERWSPSTAETKNQDTTKRRKESAIKTTTLPKPAGQTEGQGWNKKLMAGCRRPSCPHPYWPCPGFRTELPQGHSEQVKGGGGQRRQAQREEVSGQCRGLRQAGGPALGPRFGVQLARDYTPSPEAEN